MYRVVLVDDERLILEGLSRVIAWDAMGCTVVGTASDGQEGLALIGQLSGLVQLVVGVAAQLRVHPQVLQVRFRQPGAHHVRHPADAQL